jgi:hypothetical protein
MDQMTLSPYQVLQIGVEATTADIMRAYQVAVRARRHEPSVLAWALNALRNPRTRLSCDLDALEIGSVRSELADRLREAADGPSLAHMDVPLMPIERLATADIASSLADEREIPTREVSLAVSPSFAPSDDILPMIEFPS